MNETELFYIQNKGYCGDCLIWWRANSSGYTTNLDEAGKYTKEEALAVCRTRHGEDKMFPISVVDAAAVRHCTESLEGHL